MLLSFYFPQGHLHRFTDAHVKMNLYSVRYDQDVQDAKNNLDCSFNDVSYPPKNSRISLSVAEYSIIKTEELETSAKNLHSFLHNSKYVFLSPLHIWLLSATPHVRCAHLNLIANMQCGCEPFHLASNIVHFHDLVIMQISFQVNSQTLLHVALILSDRYFNKAKCLACS